MSHRRLETWLQQLDLGRYATLFDENGIEWDVVPDLTDDDLRQLGIPLGHRKRLMKAIHRLADPRAASINGVLADSLLPQPLAGQPSLSTAGPSHGVEPAVASPPPRPVSATAAPRERRQITVMFCDIVGSTALSQRLDPEDLLEVLQAYQRACAAIILDLRGTIGQYLGDGILAYFGYPRAHEDDAERAVRAGLDIIAAIARQDARLKCRHGAALAVRIGIATGIVVIGDLAANAANEERTAIGSTPNLAARLQSLASANTVIISDSTFRLTGARFAVEDRGEHALPGFSEPQRVWRVLRPLDAEDRIEKTIARGLSPFIGREPELAFLRDRWQQTVAGDGARILITGDPGIGKSRLLAALDAEIAGTPHRRLRFHCSSFHQDTAFYPVVEAIVRSAGIAFGDDNDTRLEKLQALLEANGGMVAERLPLLAALLSISTAGRYPTLDISPRKQRELTLDAIIAPIETLAQGLPVLIAFEDVQWVDPSTDEMIDRMLVRLAGLPVMIVATCRSGLVPPRFRDPGIEVIALDRLTRRRSEDLVQVLLGGRVLPPSIFDQIVERAGGVPLFVEELTKAVLHSELARDDGGGLGTAVNGLPRGIPATIHDSLMARLDQLALPRDIAQIGSVIGREFSYTLIREITGLPDPVLRESLQRLTASELVYCRGAPPVSTYSFKHALVQDAAYESLLLSRRRELHYRIARALEPRFASDATVTAEIVAYHFAMAGDGDRANPYWLKAATAAEARSATVEAVNHFKRALAIAQAGPETEARLRQELDIRLRLATALIALTGTGSDEVQESYREALAMCARLPESSLHFTALWGWWRISMNFRDGRERGDAMLALAERLKDPDLILQAHHCLWATKYNLGDQRGCLAHIEHGLALYREDEHGGLAALYGGHDVRVCALGEAAQALWLLGEPEQAMARLTEAQESARRLGHAGSIAHVLDMTLLIHRYRGDAAGVRDAAAALKRFCDDKGFPDQAAKALLFTGWADGVGGQIDRGLADLEAGIAEQRRIGTLEDFTIYLEMLAEVYQLAGRFDDGLEAIRQAFEIVDERAIYFWEAELHRRRGALLVCKGELGAAEAAFREALLTARHQDARALETRASIALASLWQDEGRVDEALALLRPIAETFDGIRGSTDAEVARCRVDELLGLAPTPPPVSASTG